MWTIFIGFIFYLQSIVLFNIQSVKANILPLKGGGKEAVWLCINKGRFTLRSTITG